MFRPTALATVLFLLVASGCDEVTYLKRLPPPTNGGVYSLANGCYVIDATRPGSSNTRYLRTNATGQGFEFAALEPASAEHFLLRPTDLGTYLLYDRDGGYLVSELGAIERASTLDSDVLRVDDTFVSPAEWELQVSAHDALRFQLRQRKTGRYLTTTGLTADESKAAVVAFYPASGCAEFPELTTDATGQIATTTFPDGELYGIADAHSHLFTNFGFGGGGILHGSPFHRLGVEHALPSCETYHGVDGRRDLIGYVYGGRASSADTTTLASLLLNGETPGFDHHTAGFPEFTDWPGRAFGDTHQTQYYRWIERAYLGGLRLLVQHATGNRILCEMVVGMGAQPVRYTCNEMYAAERTIDETYALERYVDAQSGGPGKGWFRVVTTPAEARQVISQGKLAVILGIETSNLFDCYLTPRYGDPVCDAAHVAERLDHFRGRGVRAIFPVHKFDNAFAPGDGHRGFIEIGNFVNSGYYSNYTTDCGGLPPSNFDNGSVYFGGLNMPRVQYASMAPVDTSAFEFDPIGVLLPHLSQLTVPSLPGDHCQNAGMQPLGEYLIQQLMRRGMIVEVDHLPRFAYARALELLTANDYPPAATHGNANGGLVAQLGGIATLGPGRCGDPAVPGTMAAALRARTQQNVANGGHPGVPFGFDFNGFAGQPGPRFGSDSGCGLQANPITYPFTSYAGDVTFEHPRIGNRILDFNTEGMVHIGLMPEIVEDLRRDGASDADLEPLFRSAEAYIRMWEKAETRGAVLSTTLPP